MIHHADCLDAMAAMEPESVDAIVTDPPYGLEFMGRDWDGADGFRRSLNGADAGRDNVFGRTSRRAPEYRATPLYQEWTEAWARGALRVAKPSAYLLAFGGTRTVHRMTVALEDAGWIIRDMLVWAYASGFPKSKASLKPAWEPIVMARKPGPLRELAIDACRIPFESSSDAAAAAAGYADSLRRGSVVQSVSIGRESRDGSEYTGPHERGRWPANVVLTDPIFDGGWDGVVGGGETSVAPPGRWTSAHADAAAFPIDRGGVVPTYGDSGTYSRFFLIPKADRADREPVLGGLPERESLVYSPKEQGPLPQQTPSRPSPRANHHPTVKPTELMRHLVRLVTPPGGTVLDPFLGSGTTALAAEMEGFAWVGIEREAEYIAIAEARLNGTQRGLGLTA